MYGQGATAVDRLLLELDRNLESAKFTLKRGHNTNQFAYGR